MKSMKILTLRRSINLRVTYIGHTWSSKTRLETRSEKPGSGPVPVGSTPEREG